MTAELRVKSNMPSAGIIR